MANEVTLKESDGTIIYPQIVTDCIPNDAVTADKIDWATIPYVLKELTTTQNITTSNLTYLNNLSWTVDVPGTYLVIANGNIQTYSNTDAYPRVGIYVDGVRVAYSAVHLMNGNYQYSWSVILPITLTAGQVVKVGNSNGYASFFEGNRLIAFRIA